MSLIQDALKRKTEEQNPLPDAPPPVQPLASKEPAPPPAPEPPAEKEADNSSTKKLFIILAAAIVLILLAIGSSIYLVLNQPATDETPAEVEATEQPAKPPAPAAAVAPAPAPKPEPASTSEIKWPELTFSGSAAGGNQILAIINGRMLSIGDQIKGATVLQIGKNEVLVEFEGEKRILGVDDEK